MKKIIILSLASIFLFSCGSRKVLKTSNEVKTELAYKELKEETVKETETLELDTLITKPSEFYTSSEEIENLKSGDTIKTESDSHLTKTYYNAKTKRVTSETKLKHILIPVKIKKTTERQINRKHNNEAVLNTSSKNETTNKDRKGITVNILYLVTGISLLIFFIILLGRKIAKQIIKKKL